MQASLGRRLFAEWLGTAFLLAAVVGSGIMGERLAAGNVAIALLANTLATGAMAAIFSPHSAAKRKAMPAPLVVAKGRGVVLMTLRERKSISTRPSA